LNKVVFRPQLTLTVSNVDSITRRTSLNAGLTHLRFWGGGGGGGLRALLYLCAVRPKFNQLEMVIYLYLQTHAYLQIDARVIVV